MPSTRKLMPLTSKLELAIRLKNQKKLSNLFQRRLN